MTRTADGAGHRLVTTAIKAGRRVLTQRTRRDPDVDTVWTLEHFLKDIGDVQAWLDLPEPPLGGAPETIFRRCARLGDIEGFQAYSEGIYDDINKFRLPDPRIGTARDRKSERIAAAMGLIDRVGTRFEHCKDVSMGGLLTGLPALCDNGLLSGLNRHLSLPKGFYSALHILMLLGFMALGRLRRPEALRHVTPGEIGKVLGLDRAP